MVPELTLMATFAQRTMALPADLLCDVETVARAETKTLSPGIQDALCQARDKGILHKSSRDAGELVRVAVFLSGIGVLVCWSELRYARLK